MGVFLVRRRRIREREADEVDLDDIATIQKGGSVGSGKSRSSSQSSIDYKGPLEKLERVIIYVVIYSNLCYNLSLTN